MAGQGKYVVNNNLDEVVTLYTHKINGGIYRRYHSDGRITAVLERVKDGRVVYEECNYGFDDLDYRRIDKEAAERILSVSNASDLLRSSVLKGIQ